MYRSLLSTALALIFALQPAPAAAGDLLPEIGDPVSIEVTDHLSVQPALTGCAGLQVSAVRNDYEQRVVELVNQNRANAGLPPLKRSTNLDFASRYHAKDMMDESYFGHDTQDLLNNTLVTVCSWSTRVVSYYPQWEYLSENVAAGHTSPDDVVNSWMSSDGHRRNILSSNAREIGVGFMELGGSYGRYWVQDFGRASNVFPIIINREAASTDSQQVTLYLYGQGTWNEMRLRNNTDAWSSWQPFQSSLTWTLAPTVGPQTVSVEMRKPGSTVIASSSDAITLNGGMGNLPDRIYFIYNLAKKRFYPDPAILQPQNINGNVSYSWSASATGAWIRLSQTSGTSPNSTITVTPSIQGLNISQPIPPGSITITASPAMPGSPKTIPVYLVVVEDMPYSLLLPTVRR